jgi:hypothetical protein
MRRTMALLGVALAAMLLTGAGGKIDRNFKADLAGANEVPPVVTETTGKVHFHADKDLTEIDYKLKIKDGSDILGAAGAHIHCAPEGANGPVVVFLAGAIPGGVDGKFEIRGTLTEANIVNEACGATVAELLESMANGMTYVNVHSTDNPGGEVRGQIR